MHVLAGLVFSLVWVPSELYTYWRRGEGRWEGTVEVGRQAQGARARDQERKCTGIGARGR